MRIAPACTTLLQSLEIYLQQVMPSASQKDLLQILKLIESLSASRGVLQLRNRLIQRLHSELDCNIVSYNDIDLEERTSEVAFYPENPDAPLIVDRFEALMSEHPVMTYMKRTGDGTAWKISDFITHSAFHNTEIYKQLYSKTDTEYQMASSFQPTARRMIGIACCRGALGQDFNEANRNWLNTLRPHLIQLWSLAIEMDSLKSGQGPQHKDPEGNGLLTKRELQVLDWISEGKTNAAIAKKLGLSPLTIKTHVQKILRKLEVKTRSEAVKKVYGARGG